MVTVDRRPIGEVTPRAAWDGLVRDRSAQLIDVRTRPEWSFVGIPDLSSLGRKAILASWQAYPAMAVDPDFAERLAQHLTGLGLGIETPLYFLCRSGARSQAAALAMAERGYGACFNILGGFEGDRDARGRRGAVGGWKVNNLPWIQE